MLDVARPGIFAIELVYGEPPNIGLSNEKVFAKILRDDSPKIQAKWSEELQDFVAKCLDKNVDARWTAAMLVDHPFMIGAEDLRGAWYNDYYHWLSSKEENIPDN